MRCCFCFCATGINDDHPTSENGKLAAFASGRPVFQQYAEHAEGSNTPLPRTFRKYCAQSEKNSNITKLQKDHAAQRGRDAFGTATRISASLSRRLSAFFWRTPGQDPKTAKCAVLIPGHAGFPKRVKQSEGSDTTPVRNTPVSPCVPLCAIPLSKGECVPAFARESKCGPFVREVENRNKKRFKTAL